MTSFDRVNTWVFDLDNTLYPASCRLFDQMHRKMGEYVMQRFGVDYPEAYKIQKALYHKHGTTLRGLMVEHGEAPEEFLQRVHDIDYSAVPHSPDLISALQALPGRKLVFTAGTREHATSTMERLGVADLFEAVFDIRHAEHIPKPAREPYELFLAKHDVDPKRSAFFEDIARNLEVPHDMGMVTVLVTSDVSYDDPVSQGSHVHHSTPDLSSFLINLTRVS
jgi:putative hydrolase of the HAD superfamily